MSPDALGDCPLCLEPLHADARGEAAVTFLPCSHALHKDCAAQLRRHPTARTACPVCRAPLPQTMALSPRAVGAAGVAGFVLSAAFNPFLAVLSFGVLLLQAILIFTVAAGCIACLAAYLAAVASCRRPPPVQHRTLVYQQRTFTYVRDDESSDSVVEPAERRVVPKRRAAFFKTRGRELQVVATDGVQRKNSSFRRKFVGKVRAICRM